MQCPWRLLDSCVRHLAVAPVLVVSRACPLGGDHGGAEGTLRCTKRAEGRAVTRLLPPLEDEAANTHRWLLGHDAQDGKSALGVEGRVRLPQPEAASRDLTDAAPLPVADLEHFADHRLGGAVSLAT